MSILLFIILILITDPLWAEDGKELYMKHCASCHHSERYGLKAPPLLPETLKGQKREDIVKIIMDGMPATQMPSYRVILKEEEIDKVTTYITSPVENIRWNIEDILNSKQNTPPLLKGGLIDLENIILVVESGNGITVMDGRDFKILDSFLVGTIHGGPKFSHSLSHVYTATRDGMITKYDLRNLQVAGKVRSGINTRNIAVSHDDKFVAAGNYLPRNIIILDADLNPERIIGVDGKIGGVYTLYNEKKFICSFRDKSELWLIDYNSDFNVEKLPLPEPFEDMAISPIENIIIGASRSGDGVYIYSINERKVLRSFPLEGMPHLSSAAFWLDSEGIPFVAINHLKKPVVTIINLDKMSVIKEVKLPASGFFVRTHRDTPYIWADTNTDTMYIIDKENSKVINTIVPAKGKKAMHTEFTMDGKYALVSVSEDDGAVVIYDAYKLEEVKRIPFRKPAGKYNAFNKTFPWIHPSSKSEARMRALVNQ